MKYGGNKAILSIFLKSIHAPMTFYMFMCVLHTQIHEKIAAGGQTQEEKRARDWEGREGAKATIGSEALFKTNQGVKQCCAVWNDDDVFVFNQSSNAPIVTTGQQRTQQNSFLHPPLHCLLFL